MTREQIIYKPSEQLTVGLWEAPAFIEQCVIPALKAERQRRITEAITVDLTELLIQWRFGEHNRTLSEMPLCRFWQFHPELVPAGYRVIDGVVQTKMGAKMRIGHTYAYEDGTSMILDPVAGQWPMPFNSVAPGKRASYLQDRAPELVYQCAGLLILHASREQIRLELDLDYGIG